MSKQIAVRLGRSPEAVRYTIKNFDRGHPDSALFPTSSGPLSDCGQGADLAMAHDLTKQNAKPTGDTVDT